MNILLFYEKKKEYDDDDGPSSAGGRFTGGAIQRPWPGPRSSCQGNKRASSVISSSCANMTRGVACRGRDSVVWSSTISPYTWQLPGTCVQRLSTCCHLPIPPAGAVILSLSLAGTKCAVEAWLSLVPVSLFFYAFISPCPCTYSW